MQYYHTMWNISSSSPIQTHAFCIFKKAWALDIIKIIIQLFMDYPILPKQNS